MYFIYRVRSAWNGNACTGKKNWFISTVFWTAFRLGRW